VTGQDQPARTQGVSDLSANTQRLTDIRQRDDESVPRMGPHDREFWGDLDRRYLLDVADRLATANSLLRHENTALNLELDGAYIELRKRTEAEERLMEVVAESIHENGSRCPSCGKSSCLWSVIGNPADNNIRCSFNGLVFLGTDWAPKQLQDQA
jgi:hypothetical protein